MLRAKRAAAAKGKATSLSGPEGFALGAAAKALATVFTYPLQVAQSRLRVEDCAQV
jgi:hypothetical protein